MSVFEVEPPIEFLVKKKQKTAGQRRVKQYKNLIQFGRCAALPNGANIYRWLR